jgi:hypothetical protein
MEPQPWHFFILGKAHKMHIINWLFFIPVPIVAIRLLVNSPFTAKEDHIVFCGRIGKLHC